MLLSEAPAQAGPCTRCGATAPMILPAALRHNGPPVYACPVQDMFACEGRYRARAAAPPEKPAAPEPAAPKQKPKPSARRRPPRPSQVRRDLANKTLLGQQR